MTPRGSAFRSQDYLVLRHNSRAREVADGTGPFFTLETGLQTFMCSLLTGRSDSKNIFVSSDLSFSRVFTGLRSRGFWSQTD